MKEIVKVIVAIIIVITLILGLTFGVGFIGNLFKSTVVKQSIDIERTNWKESKSHVEGMLNDLAKQKREYEMASSADKIIIANYIADVFGSFDKSKIKSIELRRFLESIRGY